MSVTTNQSNDNPLFASCNQIIQNNSDWAKEIKAYDLNRKTLPWGKTIKPHIYTKKEQAEKENIFNPISQQYYDSAYNSQLKSQEMIQMKKKITEHYDNELRNEQTFNIISLGDRLKGFEDHPDYPRKAKEKIKMNKEISQVPYNILNNIDKRAMTLSVEPIQSKQSIGVMNKDYNLITNDYLVNNKLKKQTEIEIEKLTAAKKLQQTRSAYDFIRGVFYDPEKQAQYEREQIELKNKLSLMKSDAMYNPINHYVYNKEKVDIYDHAQDNLKKRYKIKPLIDDFYRQREIDGEYTKEKQIENKLNYDRYKVEDQRGYNFLNMKPNYSVIKDTLNCRNKKDNWEILKDNAGANETLSKKGFFKDLYDISELDQHEHQYKQKRHCILKELGDYDKQFEIKKINEKLRDKPIKTENNPSRQITIDKQKWFSTGKSVDMMNFKRVSQLIHIY